MRRIFLIGILLGSLAASACIEHKLVPTAPDNVGGNSGNTSGGNSGGSTGGSTGGGNSNNSGNTGSAAASAFSGAWGSSTIAGLPLGNCSDVKWLITAQTDTSVSGTVTANCASGVTVSANLTGTMTGANTMNLVANGTLTAMGVPCQFNITGTGTRQTNDTMKVDYNGSHCFGTVNGSETLRKFPDV